MAGGKGLPLHRKPTAFANSGSYMFLSLLDQSYHFQIPYHTEVFATARGASCDSNSLTCRLWDLPESAALILCHQMHMPRVIGGEVACRCASPRSLHT